MQQKVLTDAQINLALTVQERHGLSIPYSILTGYEFGKKFLNLFSYDPDSNELTGFRRVSVIIDYYYYDKDKKHIQFKLGLTPEETEFMVTTLAKYKFNG